MFYLYLYTHPSKRSRRVLLNQDKVAICGVIPESPVWRHAGTITVEPTTTVREALEAVVRMDVVDD